MTIITIKSGGSKISNKYKKLGSAP